MATIEETLQQTEAIRQQGRSGITTALEILRHAEDYGSGPAFLGDDGRETAREFAFWVLLRSVHRQLVLSGHNVPFVRLAGAGRQIPPSLA